MRLDVALLWAGLMAGGAFGLGFGVTVACMSLFGRLTGIWS